MSPSRWRKWRSQETSSPTSCGSSPNCDRRQSRQLHEAFGVTRCTKPRETCVLKAENSASLGVPPRAGSPRNVSTSHGGLNDISVLSKSYYVPSLSRDKVVIWRMSVNGAPVENNESRP